jgi:hypothetical protein
MESAYWRVELQDDQKYLHNHGDSFVFRVILDFSNVYIYHADGYIPRKRSIFNPVFVQESVGTYSCGGWAKVDVAGILE